MKLSSEEREKVDKIRVSAFRNDKDKVSASIPIPRHALIAALPVIGPFWVLSEQLQLISYTRRITPLSKTAKASIYLRALVAFIIALVPIVGPMYMHWAQVSIYCLDRTRKYFCVFEEENTVKEESAVYEESTIDGVADSECLGRESILNAPWVVDTLSSSEMRRSLSTGPGSPLRTSIPAYSMRLANAGF